MIGSDIGVYAIRKSHCILVKTIMKKEEEDDDDDKTLAHFEIEYMII